MVILVFWRGLAIAQLETARENQHFSVAGIGLVADPILVEAHDAVQDANLTVAVFRLAKVALHFELKRVLKPLAIKSQPLAGAKGCDLIAMHDDWHVPFGMVEAARACQAPSEARLCERARARVGFFPDHPGVACTIHATPEMCDCLVAEGKFAR